MDLISRPFWKMSKNQFSATFFEDHNSHAHLFFIVPYRSMWFNLREIIFQDFILLLVWHKFWIHRLLLSAWCDNTVNSLNYINPTSKKTSNLKISARDFGSKIGTLSKHLWSTQSLILLVNSYFSSFIFRDPQVRCQLFELNLASKKHQI